MKTTAELALKLEGPAIRAFKANRIRYIIESLVDERSEPGLREAMRARICEKLGISNRYTQMLNNIVQPSLKDATAIAQILGVSLDELCLLEPEAVAS